MNVDGMYDGMPFLNPNGRGRRGKGNGLTAAQRLENEIKSKQDQIQRNLADIQKLQRQQVAQQQVRANQD